MAEFQIFGVLFCAAFLAYPRVKRFVGAVNARFKPVYQPQTSPQEARNDNRSNTQMSTNNSATLTSFQEKIESKAPAWFNYVAFEENCGNVLIIGRKGSGKSTFAYCLLACRARAGQSVIVLDPHANFNDWPIPAIGSGRDMQGIEKALQSLMAEFHRRYKLGKKDVLEPLTIFIDEAPSIMEFCPTAKQFFLAGAREFRKINMTLVILTQSANVKTLGIEGEGDSKLNFVQVHLAGKAIDRMPKEQSLRTFARPAVIEQDGFCHPVDMAQPFISGLATLAISSQSVWQPAPSPIDFSSLIDEYPNTQTLGATTEQGIDGNFGNYAPEVEAALPTDDPERAKMEAVAIRSFAKAGYTRTAIAKFLGGRTATRLAQIKQVLENGEVE